MNIPFLVALAGFCFVSNLFGESALEAAAKVTPPTITIQQAIATGERAIKESGRDLNKYMIVAAFWTTPSPGMKEDSHTAPILKEFGDGPFWGVHFLLKTWNEEIGTQTGDYYNLGVSVWVYDARTVAILDHRTEVPPAQDAKASQGQK